MSLSTLLDAIERTLSSALESGPLRAFHARLEPVHIVRDLERLLDRHALVTAGGIVVPHEMLVRLHPADQSRLSAAGSNIGADLAARVQRSVRARGRVMLGQPSVRIESDPAVPLGRVNSELLQGVREEDAAPLPATSRLPVVTRPESSLRITLPDGEVAVFTQSIVSIGRGPENDVVIPDSRVSRRHAEIHTGSGQPVLRDLESTNGTWLNGAQIQSVPLSSPARVKIGEAEILIDSPRA